MTYTAFITRIKNVRKHPDADRLQIGECFGNQVIVGMNQKSEDIGIYFGADGRLSDEFLISNNLVRKLDAEGKNIGGLFDANGKVCTQKLRGEKSDGFFCPIEYLNYTGVDTTKLEVGFAFSEIGGHEICRKFITAKTFQARERKPREKSKFITFHEMPDTEQLAYKMDELKDGMFLVFTEKLHGCFAHDTKVKLWGLPRSISISKVKIGDIVVGMKDGEIIPSTVLKVFCGNKSSIWNEIEIKRNGYLGEPLNRFRCTPNHKFWVNNIKEFIEARELLDGQQISTLKNSLILTPEQKEILLGIYLGDGFLINNHIGFSHKESHESYIDHIVYTLGNIAYKCSGFRTSGYGTIMKSGTTVDAADLKNFFIKILSDGEDGNKLTFNIEKYFTIRTLAYLYMDDGSLSHTELQEDRASIAICSYNDHDANIIKKCIENLGFKCILYKTEGYNRIRLNKDSADLMFDSISKFIPEIMRYKLPLKYRDSIFLNEQFNSKFGYVFIDSIVISNNTILCKRGCEEFDLQTTTGNYTVGNSLVHNTSQRSSYSIEELTAHSWYGNIINGIFKRTVIEPIVSKEYKYVCGTRHVVLKDFETHIGFYKENEKFREYAHNRFVGKLRKGETVYYEVVGYASENTPIMPSSDNMKLKDKEFVKKYGKVTNFTYGCHPGQHEVYVYRMSMTNEDGVEIDLSWDSVKYRCGQMEVKYVPELYRTIYNIGVDNDYFLKVCDNYAIGESTIDPTHIREGVVVRSDGSKWNAWKYKSFSFKVIEGIIKESNVVDIEEAQESV